MFGQFIIAFREAFEAALIISIIITYLIRTGREKLSRYVWISVLIAIVLSLVLSLIIWSVYGILSEINKILFEALSAYLAVIILSFMIYWMAIKGKTIKHDIEIKIESAMTSGTIISLMFASFIIVFREGVELVLFMMPFIISDAIGTIIGVVLGITMAIVFSYTIFVTGMSIDVTKLFSFTSILLIFIAGGLLGYGTHELIEYFELIGVNLDWLAESAYNLNISPDSPFHHKNIIGSIFAVMFGYTVNAEWARLIANTAYLLITVPLLIFILRKKT